MSDLSSRHKLKAVHMHSTVGDVLIAMMTTSHRVIVVDDSKNDISKILHVLRLETL